MTDYTLFGAGIPAGTSSFTGTNSADISLQVLATASCFLKGYRWWVPSGGDTAGANRSFRAYSTADGTSGALLAGSTVAGAGTWGTLQWNETLLASPVALVSGTTYAAAVTAVNDSRAYEHMWWASGGGAAGITSGPITAFGDSLALGGFTQRYTTPSAGGFVTGTTDGELYCFDLIVSDTAGAPSSGLLMAAVI